MVSTAPRSIRFRPLVFGHPFSAFDFGMARNAPDSADDNRSGGVTKTSAQNFRSVNGAIRDGQYLICC